jgi:hypothetical protein
MHRHGILGVNTTLMIAGSFGQAAQNENVVVRRTVRGSAIV